MSEETKADGTIDSSNDGTGTLMQQIVNEIIYSPLNLILIAIITFLIYQIFRTRHPKPSPPPEPEMPKMRRDFSVQELKAYDGNQADGRVLVAVNGNVYDVTKGKRFYGPGKLRRKGLALLKVTVALQLQNL
jgi:membrane-associated progesterone receptor component